nr:MAG TPA: hypothetical protein [Caudoviricetes sp.]
MTCTLASIFYPPSNFILYIILYIFIIYAKRINMDIFTDASTLNHTLEF